MCQENSEPIKQKNRIGKENTTDGPDEVMDINGCEVRLFYAPKTDENALLDIQAILHKNFTL